ncbi:MULTISPECIES: hypothetical protein [unclassified Synechococcus]|uniref:hypothetical protein n=1 Tax=unclassified Synechococcus TaxID=2626047 RepID=UPI0000698F42|nr:MULTISPECIES: hypothetical protein [unclassified Synechococcus]EAQ74093.1 hypothetical protein WH5701_12303 [Synechococcus sp. WH 5701]WFN58364.1 hypothetical protein N4320_11170 [Synechococcus sp. CCFWC 502]
MARNSSLNFVLVLIGGTLLSAGVYLSILELLMFYNRVVGCGRLGNGPAAESSCFWFAIPFATNPSQGLWLLTISFTIGLALLLSKTTRGLGWLLLVGTMAVAMAVSAVVLPSLIFGIRPDPFLGFITIMLMVGVGIGLMSRSLRS